MSDQSSNPFEPRFPGFAGFGQMMDQMESFKRLWSAMDVPSRLVPTLDLEELDKRIADLKAVEQWLNLNLGMLRGSIQGLEIQRGTLAAVQAFGASFPMPGAGFKPAASATASTAQSAAQSAASAATSAPPAVDPSSSDSSPPTPGIDPSAWWNLLQNNFQQIAQAALAGSTLPGMGEGGPVKRPTTQASGTGSASSSASSESNRSRRSSGAGSSSVRAAQGSAATGSKTKRKTPTGR